MYLNTIRVSKNYKRKHIRVGRGAGSRRGKTCGRGHKGQKSRSGWKNKIGFEGGQTPIKIRLPKFGFFSKKSLYKKEVKSKDLGKIINTNINISSLKNENIIKNKTNKIKIINFSKKFFEEKASREISKGSS